MRLISKGMIERTTLKDHRESKSRHLMRAVESVGVGIERISLAVERGVVFPGAEDNSVTCPGL